MQSVKNEEKFKFELRKLDKVLSQNIPVIIYVILVLTCLALKSASAYAGLLALAAALDPGGKSLILHP